MFGPRRASSALDGRRRRLGGEHARHTVSDSVIVARTVCARCCKFVFVARPVCEQGCIPVGVARTVYERCSTPVIVACTVHQR